MTGSGRLSLRARLLVLLICVTAAFLLIMGAVSAVVLNKRLAIQFNGDLAAAAARNPKVLAGNSNGYLARPGDAMEEHHARFFGGDLLPDRSDHSLHPGPPRDGVPGLPQPADHSAARP